MLAAHRANVFPKQRVLVIGSGGREHAIVHAFAQCPKVDRVFTSPGNFGTATASNERCTCLNVPAMANSEVVRFVEAHGISLVVVGQAILLAEGLADFLQAKVRFLAVCAPNMYFVRDM